MNQDLTQLSIFQGVQEDLLQSFSSDLERHFAHGDVIFHEGDRGDSMFVVLHGQVAISRDTIHIVTRGPLEIIGEQACIDQSIRSATVTAIGAVKLLEIPKQVFHILLSDASFTQNLLSVLSGKLREASEERTYRYAQEQALFGQFRAHVAPEVLNDLLSKGVEQYGQPRTTDAIILFSDIRGFTGRSTEMAPERVALELGVYLDAMVDIIHVHGGLVDKYIGDAIMAVWGFQPTGEDFARQAFACATAMVETASLMSFGNQPIAIGVGLNAGNVFIGNVGNDGKRQFTVLGTPVNMASRLEGQSKELKRSIVVSTSFYERLPEDLQGILETHERIALKGIGNMTCYTSQAIEGGEEA